MNKNKIIFIIIGIVVIFLVFVMIKIANNSGTTNITKKTSPSDFSIWTYGLDKEKVTSIVNDFKKTNETYNAKNISVENFSNYEDYKQSLTTAMISGKGPDIFMLNNFEKSYLNENILGINPAILKTNDFRKNFKTFFGDDLISSQDDSKGNNIEFVTGIPVGYETLGIYYNRKFNIKSTDLASWAAINNVIDTLKERDSEIKPIGIYSDKSLNLLADTLTQFFLLSDEKITGYKKISDIAMKEGFGSYYSYILDNTTNTGIYTKSNSEKSDLELFSDGDEAMIIGYPSMINNIDNLGFNKNFLFAEPFPHYFEGKGKTLTKYNYFVVNKTNKDEKFAFDLLAYFSTESGEKAFLENFPYLLPALVTLEQDKLQEKIHSSYNLILGDFYKEANSSLLSSYDKGITDLYDNGFSSISTDDTNYLEKTKSLISTVGCKYDKYVKLENLSYDCNKN
ncbi:MAG: ABC transporter substrate-binding protein [Candidatus Gracilibacteria bacterium]|nr:ABC transporter substrate-binding protein [Candidatus Gracilibacteria bacterium]